MDLDLNTTIADVTVYPDRALITRRGTVELAAAGHHTLRIGGLPLGAQRDSLRASGRGPAGMRILSVEQEQEFRPAAPEATLVALREAITRAERDQARLQDQKQTLEEQRGWLRALGEQSARSLAWGVARGTAKPDDAGALFAYTAGESDRLASAAAELQQRREDGERELQALRREYAQVGGGTSPDRLAAAIRVEMAEPGPVAIELSYLIYGASWQSRYDARVNVAAAAVRLTHQALVSQRTGEDWSGVALALSTARPAVAARLPDEPDPWYVDVAQPPTPAPRMPAMARRMSASVRGLSDAASEASDELAFAAPMAAAMPLMEEASLATAEVERSGAAQVFRLPGGVDVPSDGAPHTLSVGEFDLPCQLDYVAVPVIAPGAHLRATVTNSTGAVLLPGALHVFHTGAGGDEYVGATQIELTAEQAELPLYLGVDDNVSVKRELIERDTDKGSLLQSGVRRVTLGYRVTLANRTPAAQRVQLKDRLPVTRHERIKVKVLEMKTAPAAHTKLEQLTWTVALAPGEERRIEWRVLVEAPAELDVTGLP
ncbi:MAG TPA: mucoidy inhibitor MuiA family protein [Ktedonobacterales bacterium]|nr:mucoidy inhibitor MuiA family protein [Ktedonobacterales bacterium]